MRLTCTVWEWFQRWVFMLSSHHVGQSLAESFKTSRERYMTWKVMTITVKGHSDFKLSVPSHRERTFIRSLEILEDWLSARFSNKYLLGRPITSYLWGRGWNDEFFEVFIENKEMTSWKQKCTIFLVPMDDHSGRYFLVHGLSRDVHEVLWKSRCQMRYEINHDLKKHALQLNVVPRDAAIVFALMRQEVDDVLDALAWSGYSCHERVLEWLRIINAPRKTSEMVKLLFTPHSGLELAKRLQELGHFISSEVIDATLDLANL